MLARFFALPWNEKSLVLRAVLRLAHARITLATSGPTLAQTAGVREHEGRPRYSPRQLATAVERASRLLPGSTCLPKAMALAAMLRADHHDCALRLGVKQEQATLAAHAWVEINGEPVTAGNFAASEFETLPVVASSQDHSHVG